MADREALASYACCRCQKPAKAPDSSALALLQICETCQAQRYELGLAAQRKAEAEEAAHA